MTASVKASLARDYDRRDRDPRARAFYNGAAWRSFRLMQLREHPLCGRCEAAGRIVPATHVHHIVELRADWSLRLEPSNAESLCAGCHSRHHAARARA